MCGRFTLTAEWGLVRDWFWIELLEKQELYIPRYNAAPGQQVLAVIDHEGVRRAGWLHWGLAAAGGRDRTAARRAPLINARAETVADKPTFRHLLARRRCLIPADGYYEWKRLPDGRKQPYRIILKDRPLFAFAALYDTVIDDKGEKRHGCVIITTPANAAVGEIHDRMPAILRREDETLWLDRSVTEPERLLPLLRPYEEDAVHSYPVSPAVGNARRDEPSLIREWKGDDEEGGSDGEGLIQTLF